ncbi:hypothetical protein [Luteibacter yeojuensis]|uniref:Uncharacterized protein n=1 Tax=Luteibacter yeojuensis TaxID=345309 RepID=A0A7X5QRZ8_9GAMM|nr:hypothetical protein [Luteibacter yeojuensis]NID14347.1 hypothetical protein [Luteibacter yeojuensis]
MSSQTMRQRHGIEQYRDLERTRRSDFRDAANARGFTCAPAANEVPHAEDSSFGAWCLTILAIIGFVVFVTQVMSLSETHQRLRDMKHACEAQGLRAVVVDRQGRDDVVCVGGVR